MENNERKMGRKYLKHIYIVLLVGLLICSWEDIRSHTVSLSFVIAWTGLLCGIRIFQKEFSGMLFVAAILMIGIATVLNRFTGGGIGLGDGFLLAMAIMGLGARSIQMFVYCFLGTFCFAVILLVLFSKKKETKIPLAPFILGGSLLAIL